MREKRRTYTQTQPFLVRFSLLRYYLTLPLLFLFIIDLFPDRPREDAAIFKRCGSCVGLWDFVVTHPFFILAACPGILSADAFFLPAQETRPLATFLVSPLSSHVSRAKKWSFSGVFIRPIGSTIQVDQRCVNLCLG